MSLLTKIIIGAAGAGLVIGGVVGVLSAPDSAAGTLARDAVPVYLCPGEGEVGSLHRGDRVLVTGRSGDWLAVRNVRGAGERVFVAAAAIVPDADLSGLPEVDCDDAGSVAFGEITTTTVDESTTTTEPDDDTATTSSAPGTTVPGVTTTTAAVTTTTAPDQTGPAIANASASNQLIYEGGASDCPGPFQSTISAHITDTSPISSVTVRWTVPNKPQTVKPMTPSGSTYSAVFGPFTFPEFPNAIPYQTVMQITIVAVDSESNQSSTSINVTVRHNGHGDCSLG